MRLDERDDAHSLAASGTRERVHLEDALDEPRPATPALGAARREGIVDGDLTTVQTPDRLPSLGGMFGALGTTGTGPTVR